MHRSSSQCRKGTSALVAAVALCAACATTNPIGDGSGGFQGFGGFGSSEDAATSGEGGSVSSGGAVCDDGVCASAESCLDCPEDCGPCERECGDGTCDDATEDCDTCAMDCGVCSVCGDGTCQPDEDCKLCYEDCGICACKPDSFEVNNSSANATTVASGVEYCDLSVCSGDVDWLEFTVVKGFTAKATFKQGQGDIDLEIYNAQTLNYITGAYSHDDDESVTLSNLAAGTYWARVYGYMSATNPDVCFRVDTN